VARENDDRNISVDVLRTISIAMVVLLHTALYFGLKPVPENSGYYGVSLFFVISGYLITSGAMRRYRTLSKVNAAEFYRFRASRILPGLCLLAAVNVTLFAANVPGFELVQTTPGTIWDLLFYVFTFRANVYFQSGLLPAAAWGVLWSLAIEEVFYLFFPIVCLSLPKRAIIAFLCALIFAGSLARHVYGTPALYSYFGCFDQLALGCLTAIFAPRFRLSDLAAKALQAWSVLLALPVFLFVSPLKEFAPILMAFAGAMFIAGSLRPRAAPAVMRYITAPGRWTYEIYLFHNVVLLILLAGGAIDFARTHFGSRYNLLLLLAAITIISGSISVFILSPLQGFLRGLRLRRERIGAAVIPMDMPAGMGAAELPVSHRDRA
jgi:peptidoglycan/LPS O-acetylase OafA/YrhL